MSVFVWKFAKVFLALCAPQDLKDFKEGLLLFFFFAWSENLFAFLIRSSASNKLFEAKYSKMEQEKFVEGSF